MEIIGEYPEGVIAKLSIEEVSNLTGYSSRYSGGFNKPKIGDKISITYLFTRITTIEHLLERGLSEAIDNLNTKVKALNTAKNLFKDLTFKISNNETN